jgi:hypothetical protein
MGPALAVLPSMRAQGRGALSKRTAVNWLAAIAVNAVDFDLCLVD